VLQVPHQADVAARVEIRGTDLTALLISIALALALADLALVWFGRFPHVVWKTRQ
jgi:hypothetical protein